GEGSLEDVNNYVQLHYDSGYTFKEYKINTKTLETIVVIDVTTGSAITGSAITGTAIRVDITTILDLYYDKDKSNKPNKPKPPVIIEDPEIPLAELEKFDHFAYIIGYPEGDVRPLKDITREEVAMIFYRLLTDESRNALLSDENPFSDMDELHQWSNRAVSTLYNAGIIMGYPDGTFRPSDPITRAEFATIAAKFDKLDLSNITKFTDVIGHWAEKYITSSEMKGWIKGYLDNTFKPEQDITRAESMTLINNVLGRAVIEENIHPGAMFWPDNPSTEWYFEAVMEATNSHDYVYEEITLLELWTGMKPNKVWP
ncbi:MAG: S-layer homology domain-containing protein, partial [Tissierellia bacterium]|nr:S-layer homology domain-containing protein [Tissierellia bacterium]